MGELRHNRAGYSLVELLIVLAIVGILATFSISNLLASRSHAQLERGELAVTSILKEARSLALSEEVNTRVVFDSAAGTMTLSQQDNTTGLWDQVGEVQELTDGVSFSAGGITLTDSTASFTPRGTLMSGGNITIENIDGETSTFVGNIVTGKFPIGGGNLR